MTSSLPHGGSTGESAVAAFLLADSRLPSGAYSHSAGLEPAVMAGLQVEGVYPYLVSRLQTVGRMETVAAVLAHRRALELCTAAGGEDDGGAPGFAALEAALDARTPSAAQRDASRRLGRGMLRLAATLKPGDPAVAALKREAPRPTRPVALGVAARALGVGEAALARLCCYDDAQSVVAAALKLLPIDPMTATGWILAAEPQINAVADDALQARDLDDLPALSAPLMEHWAEDHTERTRRLFVA
ncbi:urease accessory protein UreF [Arthrobacter sunyaminii]|uniref:Urease accessory protein UreF n=1 Tax=Arthrobacter sunyaminii TaxID=2816859 RepID=A0A975S736_9MICC|nr:urease accessory UreF family protein [Arthrobacter sunyaminii]MBO0907990.1 urease accessory protein UreF [Arthrobacter sunyaminii]QWQ37033.1 urease accessory protein UreF [Arthrobacter sunyaminii]